MTELLKTFAPISLEQMSSVKLMNRTDTKFVTTQQRLQQLLTMALKDYYIQETPPISTLVASTCTASTSTGTPTARRYASARIASAGCSSWR